MLYDCFPFFNELDILEIRLNTLDSIADRFVLVEAVWTHAGNPKPLYFEQSKDEPRFAKFKDKIIHIIVDDQPEWNQQTWYLENYQRNAISRALTDCRPDDIIMISDVDEIPFPEKVVELRGKQGIQSIIPYYFGYYLNLFRFGYRLKLGCNILSYSDYLTILDDETVLGSFFQSAAGEGTNATKIRLYFGSKKILHNWFGWHFSYLGGAQRVLEKLQNFAHQEHNNDLSLEKLELAIANKTLLGEKLTLVEIDQSFPPYILENLIRFEHLIYPVSKRIYSAKRVLSAHRRFFYLKKEIKKAVWKTLSLLIGLIPIRVFRSSLQKKMAVKAATWEIREYD